MAIENSSQIHFRNYIRFGRYAIYAAISGHFAFFLVFLYLDVLPLVIVNIASVIIYVVCLMRLNPSLESNDFTLIGWLVYIELIGHAILASYYIGIHCGFHYYIVVLAALPFLTFTDSKAIGVVKIILIILLFSMIDGTMYDYVPPYRIEQEFSNSLRLINITIFISATLLISLFYAKINLDIRKQLENASTTDQLTGLHNRRLFIHLAELEITKIRRQRSTLSLIMLDIDDFKNINDQHGHNCGDDVLKHIAQMIRETVRPEDIASRWGGEEFIVLLPGTNIKQARTVADRIRERIANDPLRYRDEALTITVTLGITSCNNPDMPLDELTEQADYAMYLGKAKGKNQCVAFQH
jgi:diguanylate cyclase (GGDEF)-like protein